MDKKEKILKAALQLFVEFGFHGTPTSKIAEVAEVSNGTLFRYFKTKDDLIVSLYKYVKEELNEYLSDKIGINEDIKERFRNLYIHAILWQIKNKNEHHFIQQFHYSPHVKLLLSNDLLDQSHLPVSLFNEGFEKKIFKEYPVEMIYSLSRSLMNGMYDYMYDKKMSLKEQKRLLSETFEMSWSLLTP
ncbi:TetR/AcrR family transcriptional regulator [Flavobacterium aquidurense]|uniref:TetR/AcrR family transcriptional regulator n=1 Tax=Flavobacterium aquidurense TaxID=362413 RepID=UPI0037572959